MPRPPATLTTAALWLLAAAFAGWTVVRIGGLESGYPATSLVAFTPWVGLLAPLGAAVALLLGRRLPAVVMALSALLLAAVLAPRALPDGPSDPAPTGPELRVLGANLLQGAADLDALAARALELDIDVISFSELTPQGANAITGSELGQQLPHRLFQTAPGSNGTGLISRYPLRALPAPGTRGNDLPTIIAEARFPGGARAEIYSIHPFAPVGSFEVSQLERYLDAIPPADRQGAPRVLIGDFNATLDNEALRDVVDSGYVDAAAARGAGLEWTWPRRMYPPPVTIDHVIVDERIEILDFETYELERSDHRMVFAVMRIPEPG